jgi:hypothetical protein
MGAVILAITAPFFCPSPSTSAPSCGGETPRVTTTPHPEPTNLAAGAAPQRWLIACEGARHPMPTLSLRAGVLGAALLASGCGVPALTVSPGGLRSPYTGYSSALYRDDKMWICRPDLPFDVCRGDATATELLADHSRSIVPAGPAPQPDIDCFYVYPTVDLDLLPGNQSAAADRAPAARATLSQLTPFNGVCKLYVPVYRQVTIGTYLFGQGEGPRSDVAFSDVQDAFFHYMGRYNHGRKIVLIGHSQGAGVVVRLLQDVFERDPVMMSRLLLAMPIGGPVEVPKGRTVGGTFDTLPLCTKPDEIGCVIAYQSRAAGGEVGKPAFVPQPGNEIACVNPANLGGTGAHRFSRSLFPLTVDSRPMLKGIEGIDTPFVMLRDFYTGECTDGPGGYRYLAVAAAPLTGDQRVSPVDLKASNANGIMGLHQVDFQFPMGDLVDLVASRAKKLH